MCSGSLGFPESSFLSVFADGPPAKSPAKEAQHVQLELFVQSGIKKQSQLQLTTHYGSFLLITTF